VLTMNKPRKSDEGKNDGKPRKKNLNVKLSTGETIEKIASLRGLSMEAFFEQPDVQRFITHLLAAEIEKAAKQLKAQS
jgi:hypothetical protein